MSSIRLRLVQACLAAALLLGSGRAFADKVAVLPFISVANATSAELDQARAATRTAVIALSHTLPTDPEMLTAQMSVKDGVADTSEEYRAAGRASGSDWTVLGHTEQHGATYRLEIDACQIATGRVESLAREIDPSQAAGEIREMLALLLRAEGLANADIPWEHTGPAVPPPVTTPVVVTPPLSPPTSVTVQHAYAERHPVAIGLGVGGLGALHRPANAVGSSAAFLGVGSAGYALDAAPGLELRANFADSIAGPASFSFDAGARYAFALAPGLRLFAGPELLLGAFITRGGDQTARFLLHPDAFVSLGIGEHVQVEVAGEIEYAPGGSSSLLLGGGTIRGVVRF